MKISNYIDFTKTILIKICQLFVIILSIFLAILYIIIEFFMYVSTDIYRFFYDKTRVGMMSLSLRSNPLSIIENHEKYKSVNLNKYYTIDYPYIKSIDEIDYFHETIVIPPKYNFIGYCICDMQRNFSFRCGYMQYRELLLHFFKYYEYELDIKIDNTFQRSVLSYVIYKESLFFFKKFTKGKALKDFLKEKDIIEILYNSMDIKLLIYLLNNIEPKEIDFLLSNLVVNGINQLPSAIRGRLQTVSFRTSIILKILQKKNYDISALSKRLDVVFSDKDKGQVEKSILISDFTIDKLKKDVHVRKI